MDLENNTLSSNQEVQNLELFITNNFPIFLDMFARRDLAEVKLNNKKIPEDEFHLEKYVADINEQLQSIEGVMAHGFSKGISTGKKLFFMTQRQAVLFCATVEVGARLDF